MFIFINYKIIICGDFVLITKIQSLRARIETTDEAVWEFRGLPTVMCFDKQGCGKEKVNLILTGLSIIAPNCPFHPCSSHQPGTVEGSRGPKHGNTISWAPAVCSTHQICKDVVVADAILLQLYNLKKRKGRGSLIILAIEATTAIIIGTNINWVLTVCSALT